jgi:hypothetical protein
VKFEKDKSDKNDDDTTAGIPNDVLNEINKITEGNDDAGDDDKVDDDKVDDDKVDDDKVDDDKVDDDKVDDDKVDDDKVDDDKVDDDTGDDDDVDDDVVDNSPIALLGYDEKRIKELNAIDPELVEDIRSLVADGSLGQDDDDDDDDSLEGDDSKHIDHTVKVDDGDVITDEQMKTLEKENPAMAAIVKGLSTKVGQLSNALSTVSEAEIEREAKAAQRENFNNFRSTNKRLDELEKDFPIFGTYKDLPKMENGVPNPRNRCVKERSKLWDMAYALDQTGKFETFEDSLDSAIVLYAGKNGKKKAMREVVGDLNSRKKKFTHRPNRNKTKVKGPEPGSEEFKKKIVRDALEGTGVTA